MKRISFVAIAMLFAACPASASSLSAILYGGPTQNLANCYIYNSGTGPVTIVSKELFVYPSTPLPISGTNCGPTLAAGTMCGINAATAATEAHSCKFVVLPDGAAIRGVFEMRRAATVLQNTPLR